MKDCCKDAFIEGIRHIQQFHEGHKYITIYELRSMIDYSINLLERNKTFKLEKERKDIEL